MAKKKPQLELFEADVSWFHIFKELIKSKTWAKMSPAARAVYPVIKAFTNWKDGYAFPSFDTLMEYSGLNSRTSIGKALRELEKVGYIQAKRTKGKATVYKLVEKFAVTDQEGRPAASVSFDYLPAMVKDATTELRNFLAEGMTDEGKLQYIHIEHLTLNIAGRDTVHGQYIENQNNLDMGKATIKGIRDMIEGRKTPEAKEVVKMLEEGETKK